MLINDPKRELDPVKEVKVKIPVSLHIRLHSMKVLTGRQISDAVTEALEAYFAESRQQAERAATTAALFAEENA